MSDRKSKTKYSVRRPASGQAIIEGVVALLLIVFGTVCAVLLLINVGFSVYYKDKLGFIANQCAQYAATQDESNRQTKTTDFAKALLNQFGYNSDTAECEVQAVQVAGEQAIQVNLENTFPLFQSAASFLPGSIRLDEKAVVAVGAVNGGLKIEGYLSFKPIGPGPVPGGGTDVQVPIVKLQSFGKGTDVSGRLRFAGNGTVPLTAVEKGAGFGP